MNENIPYICLTETFIDGFYWIDLKSHYENGVRILARFNSDLGMEQIIKAARLLLPVGAALVNEVSNEQA